MHQNILLMEERMTEDHTLWNPEEREGAQHMAGSANTN